MRCLLCVPRSTESASQPSGATTIVESTPALRKLRTTASACTSSSSTTRISALPSTCSNLISIQRPPDRESTPAPHVDRGNNIDAAAGSLDPLFYDCQPDAAGVLAFHGCQRLKQLEDTDLILRCDSRAIIGHADRAERAVARRIDDNLAVRSVVMLDRIGKQVAQHRLERRTRGEQRPRRVVHVHLKRVGDSEIVDYVLHQGVEHDRLARNMVTADARIVEQ